MSSRAARKAREKRRVVATVSTESAPRSTMRPVAPQLDTPEEAAIQVIGAVLESIAAPLGLSAESPEVETTDHRAHPRVAFEVEINLHSDSHFFSGLSGDVSEGGLFVQTYRPLAVGDHVEVAFDLPDGRVEANGVVRWRRAQGDTMDAGVGIEFEGLSERDRAVIHGFCEQRAPLYYELS